MPQAGSRSRWGLTLLETRSPNQRHHESALGAVLGSASSIARESNAWVLVFMTPSPDREIGPRRQD
jgi:hypothetical protein